MIFLNYLKIRWLHCCLILFFIGCLNAPKPYKDYIPTAEDSIQNVRKLQRAVDSIKTYKQLIKSGDIITRTGNDFTSQSLRTLNQRNTSFSHIGIASVENDSIFIYHALGGDFNPDQKLIREHFDYFSSPIDNNGFGIFRFDSTALLPSQLIPIIQHFFQQEIMFDMDFNLTTDERMYCAEFVYKSLKLASNNRLQFPLSHINEFEFIGVDDIFLHPQCREIKLIWYK